MDQGLDTSGSTIASLPRRPQRGKNFKNVGVPIKLVSNHFHVDFIDGNKGVYVYSYLIEPELVQDARNVRDQILRNCRKAINEAGLKDFNARGRNIWAYEKVTKPIIVASADDTGVKYTVKIDFVKENNYRDFATENKDDKMVAPITQSVNVSVKRVLKELGLVEIGRLSKFFNPKLINDNQLKEHGLKVWRGFKTSLQVYLSKPYLQIDFASRVLREESALDMMKPFMQGRNFTFEDLKYHLVGLSVLASYGNFRLYRIDDINPKLTPKSEFVLNDGKKISYVDYYRTRYNQQIRNLDQPLIESKDRRNPEKKTYLIPELVKMTGITDMQKKDFRIMKDLAQFTKLEPVERQNEVMKIHSKLKEALVKHNIKLSSESNVQGILLNPPVLLVGQGKKMQADSTGFFIMKDQAFKGAYIKDWFLVYEGKGQRDDEDADDLANEIQKAGNRLGIKVDKPYFIVLNNSSSKAWAAEIEKEFKQGLPQIVVTFISDRLRVNKGDEDLYTALKRLLLNKHGVSHQNILLKFNKNKNKPSVASKIVQQMSVKLGNPLWVVPKIPAISDKVLIIGIDIYHKQILKNQSCMGFVAHFDADCTTTYSRALLMRQGQEMNQELGRVFKECLEAYFVRNGKKYLPEAIVVYRDGVGASQVDALLRTEIAQFKKVIQSFKGYEPQFAALMINKKITDRFFAQSNDLPNSVRRSKDNAPLVNPPSGTIVAEKVISQNADFFLAAQYVTQGTCTPTHFLILDNTTDWPEEVFWQLTYNQCFNYQNWSGAVRVPACVQYAHKLAFLVGDTFKDQIHEKLLDKASYL